MAAERHEGKNILRNFVPKKLDKILNKQYISYTISFACIFFSLSHFTLNLSYACYLSHIHFKQKKWAERELNPHGSCEPQDFKSCASASSAIRPTIKIAILKNYTTFSGSFQTNDNDRLKAS